MLNPLITKTKAAQINITSGSATYYTETETIEFHFSFSRPLDSPTADYFIFGGTNPSNSNEFFIVSYVTPEISRIEYCDPVCEIMGNFAHDVIAADYQLMVNYANLGISVPVFQIAADVKGPHPAKMVSFGVDYPIYSAINVPQVHLIEPASIVSALFSVVSIAAMARRSKIIPTYRGYAR